jgi:hypothetical protein
MDAGEAFCIEGLGATPGALDRPAFEHLPVFDCASPCDRTGRRCLSVDS